MVSAVIIQYEHRYRFRLVVRLVWKAAQGNVSKYLYRGFDYPLHVELGPHQAFRKTIRILIRWGAINNYNGRCNTLPSVIVDVIGIGNEVAVAVPTRFSVGSHDRLIFYRRPRFGCRFLTQY